MLGHANFLSKLHPLMANSDLCPSFCPRSGRQPQSGISPGGLASVLEGAVSPAFGAAIIIMVTVLVSGGAYLWFLRYVCGGCCQPMQVEPTADGEASKVEEQV